MSETTANTAHLRRGNLWSSQLKDVLEDELSAQGAADRHIQANGNHQVLEHLAVLAAWAIVGLPLSILGFRLCLDRARALGTLGHF